MNKGKIENLERSLELLYSKKKRDLPFHGWQHIIFVKNKSKIFSDELNADSFIVQSAALVHDLNYVIEKNSHSKSGNELRKSYLLSSGYSEAEIEKIERIIQEEDTSTRGKDISDEAKALSDADTLFKSLPITPVIFAEKYMKENNITISHLVQRIIVDQNKLMNEGIYFYTEHAKKNYLSWAKTNLDLWNNISNALEDEDVKTLLNIEPERLI